MPQFLRRLLRICALALALAPFAWAILATFDEDTNLVVTAAYFGMWLSAAFLIVPALAAALVWWLAGFIRDPDDER